MKKSILITFVFILFFSCKETPKETKEKIAETTVEPKEQSEWIQLFDGTSLNEWRAYLGDDVPKYWSIKDSTLVFTPPTPEERKADGGKEDSTFNIVTKRNFGSFVLSLEWKISEGGNSGIFWGVQEDEKYDEPYRTGMEIQVLDNQKHPDAKNGTSHQAGALYDLVSPSTDATKPVGEWNTYVITIDHIANKGSSVVNGVEVTTFPVNGDKLKTLIAGSKFDGWEGFAQFKSGKIGLQDHNDIVSYRNIKIKEL